MTPEQPPAGRPDQIEAVDDYVDALLSGRRPTPPRSVHGDDAAALRMAALLSSAGSPRSQPSAAFVDELRARLLPPRRRWFEFRLTRREVARAFVGAGAALAVCLFGEQAWQRLRGGEPAPAGWVPVAKAAELPPGTVRRFVAGDVQGHVMNIGGRIWALSAICTHMACVLDWRAQAEEFVCACHGARFDMGGQQLGIDSYRTPLPPLSKIPVQQRNGVIYVVPADNG